MILDFRIHPTTPECTEYSFGRCLVDGVEVKQAFYVDTDAGVVLSYEVIDDNKPHLCSEGRALFPEGLPAGIDITEDGLLYKTLSGRVQLFHKGEADA